MALSALGMLVASRIRKLENFAVAMNFVIFPMFFLSGALYPTEKLAAWLQPLVRLNPLTYGVDLMRHYMLAEEFRAVSHVEFEPIFDIAYLVVFAVVCLAVAAKLFGREEHLSAMFLGTAPGRKPPPKKVGVGRLRLPAPAGPLSGIVGREFKRAIRQRGRLASTFARPLLWLIAAGTGFSALIPGGDYETYLLPGIIGMVILFSCLLSALGSVHDRQFGPMRMLLIAPVPRGLVVFGKTLSSTLLGAAFAVVFSVLVVFFNIEVSFHDYLGFLGAALLCALALSSLGMLAASRIRKLEDFAVAMNFVIFPLFFFSGALYPASQLPGWMQPLVRLNPLTYGVDLMRQTLLHSERRRPRPGPVRTPGSTSPTSPPSRSSASRWPRFLFGREEHLAPMLLGGAAQTASRLACRSDGAHLRRSQRLADPPDHARFVGGAGRRAPRPAADGGGGDARRDLRRLHPQSRNRRLPAGAQQPARAGRGRRRNSTTPSPPPRRTAAAGRLFAMERSGDMRVGRTIADLDAAAECGPAGRRPPPRGRRGDRRRAGVARPLVRGGAALARPGLEPTQRLRQRRPLPLPLDPRHRARA